MLNKTPNLEVMMVHILWAALLISLTQFVLAFNITAYAQEADRTQQPGGPLKIDPSKLGITVPLSNNEGNLQAIFDFGGRGFGNIIKNGDGTIFAVTNRPATKSGYVHIWLRFDNGDLQFINDVNGRVARMLNGQPAEWAKDFLLVEGISGREVFLRTIEGTSPSIASEYRLAIRVGEKGELMLASGASLKLPDNVSGHEVRRCKDTSIGIEMLLTPVADNMQSFYNNRVQIYNIDTIEPAAASAGIAIVLPDNEDPLGGSKCLAIRTFARIDIKAAHAAYDPITGLSLSIPTRSPDFQTGKSKPGPQLNILINLQQSSVTIK